MQDPSAPNPQDTTGVGVTPDPTPNANTPPMDRPAFLTVETTPSNPSVSSSPTTPEPAPSVTPVNSILTPPDSTAAAPPPPPFESNTGGKNTKKIVTALGVLALLTGIGATVFLTTRQQLQPAAAWDCGKYNFAVSREGGVTVINGSTRNEPPQKADVKIDGNQAASFDVPALSPGQSQKLGDISVPSDKGFTWEVIGTVDCRDGGSYSATTEAGARCVAIKAYDTSWKQLSANELASLKAGATVRFAVEGSVTSGNIDKARFKINSVTRNEVTNKRPGSEEFYDEYVIPAGTTSFNITAEVHHQQTNKWY